MKETYSNFLNSVKIFSWINPLVTKMPFWWYTFLLLYVNSFPNISVIFPPASEIIQWDAAVSHSFILFVVVMYTSAWPELILPTFNELPMLVKSLIPIFSMKSFSLSDKWCLEPIVLHLGSSEILVTDIFSHLLSEYLKAPQFFWQKWNRGTKVSR